MQRLYRVVHITTVHPRFDGRIFLKECSFLAASGIETHLVVADGKGLQRAKGVVIHDVGVKNYSRIFRVIYRVLGAARFCMRLKPQLVHIHDPELLLIAPFLIFKGIKVVFDSHEDTKMQIMRKGYLPPWLRGAISRTYALFERTITAFVSGVVVPQYSMLQEFKWVRNLVVIPNYADLASFPVRHRSYEKPIIFHAGGLSEDRGLINMVNAVNKLSMDYECYFAGPLVGFENGVEWGRSSYLGVLSFEDVCRFYEKSNIGLILYNPVGQYGMANAVKAFEYMANSIPFIMPNFGEWIQFNEKHKCGININVADALSVANSIQFLVENPDVATELGNNGRRSVEDEFSWQAVAPRLLSFYQEILT